MKNKIYLAGCLLGAIVAAVFIASPATVGQLADSRDAHPDDVRVRYAQANLRLAEIELQIAESGNKEIPAMYSQRSIQQLRNNVAYAKEMLRYETGQEEKGLHAVHLQQVKNEAELAEASLAAAVSANKRLPGSFTRLEMERLRVAAEVARLALEKARDPTMTQNPLEHLQWQLDRLRSELSRLELEVDRIASGS